MFVFFVFIYHSLRPLNLELRNLIILDCPPSKKKNKKLGFDLAVFWDITTFMGTRKHIINHLLFLFLSPSIEGTSDISIQRSAADITSINGMLFEKKKELEYRQRSQGWKKYMEKIIWELTRRISVWSVRSELIFLGDPKFK